MASLISIVASRVPVLPAGTAAEGARGASGLGSSNGGQQALAFLAQGGGRGAGVSGGAVTDGVEMVHSTVPMSATGTEGTAAPGAAYGPMAMTTRPEDSVGHTLDLLA
jgi:hypothetical protein